MRCFFLGQRNLKARYGNEQFPLHVGDVSFGRTITVFLNPIRKAVSLLGTADQWAWFNSFYRGFLLALFLSDQISKRNGQTHFATVATPVQGEF